MTLRRATPIAGSLAMLGLLLSTSIQADEYDKKIAGGALGVRALARIER